MREPVSTTTIELAKSLALFLLRDAEIAARVQ